MKKLIHLFLLLIFTANGFAQQLNKKDTLVKSFKEEYSKIAKGLYKIPLDNSHLKLNTLISSIENYLITNKDSLSNLEKKIKNAHERTITLLIGSVLVPQGQYDSVNYYHQVLVNQNAYPYWLGRSESMLGWTKSAQSDYVGFISSLKKSLKYYEESTHSNTKYRKIQILMELSRFFTNQKLTANAKELIPVLKYELHHFEDKDRIIEFITDLQLVEAELLIYENKKQEALLLLNKIDAEAIKNNMQRIFIYEKLYFIYFKLNNYEKAFKYFNIIFNDPLFNRNSESKKHKNLGLLKFALAKGDTEEAKKHITYLENNPFIAQDKMLDVHQNYAEFYEQTKNYILANKHIKKLFYLQDSIFTSELNLINEINNYNLVYEKELVRLNDEKNKAALVLKEERKQNIIILLLVVFILITFFLTLINIKKNKRVKTQLELEKTKEILTTKNIFLENISHEVRTPITIINGYLSLTKESILEPKKVLEYANLISKNTDGLLSSLNNFLTVFKSQTLNNGKQRKETKNLDAFCENIVLDFKGVCEVKKISLYYKTNLKEKLVVKYDYFNLQKILYNLISNAIKYSNSNTNIYVALSVQKNSFQITVKDEGFGISKNDQEHIFERFYQSDKHLVTGGFGIGLSLVKQLVENLEGTIDLKSELNVGSLFTINLPLAIDNPILYRKVIKANYTLLSDIGSEKTIANNLPKVLIVDDNIELIKYYEKIFSSLLNCSFAFNGKEALEKIKTETFDLIISDLRMPILDGVMLKTEINKLLGAYKDIPFILVTSVPYDFIDNKNMNIGLNDYIVKPFEKDEIIARVRTLLENKLYAKKVLAKDEISKVAFNSEYSELLEKINGIIRENLNNTDYDLKTLASACGYTQRNLNRILQKATGLTLVKIVLEIRLQKAYEYIVNNSYSSINEIMFETGFNSRPYFYKKFKERFGIKPGILKKKYA